eukprot:scaffold20345_cov21-Tisochrysis_lutea.AAC.1
MSPTIALPTARAHPHRGGRHRLLLALLARGEAQSRQNHARGCGSHEGGHPEGAQAPLSCYVQGCLTTCDLVPYCLRLLPLLSPC